MRSYQATMHRVNFHRQDDEMHKQTLFHMNPKLQRTLRASALSSLLVSEKHLHCGVNSMGVSIPFNKSATGTTVYFAVRFAHPNAFSTSQTRKTLYEIG